MFHHIYLNCHFYFAHGWFHGFGHGWFHGFGHGWFHGFGHGRK